VRGTLRDHRRLPVANLTLTLAGRVVKTDAQGNFKFDEVPAGQQMIELQVSNNPRETPEYRLVEVVAGKVVRIVVALPPPPPPPPPDRGPCCKPYGAPPARRRVV